MQVKPPLGFQPALEIEEAGPLMGEVGSWHNPHRYAGDCHYILLEGLTQDLQDVASELRQLIQQEHAMVRQRDFAGYRHLPATDQPHIRDGVMGA
jgi:hypothetical protein